VADVLIALGGNVGDVHRHSKAIANICGMTQAALIARSSDYATPRGATRSKNASSTPVSKLTPA